MSTTHNDVQTPPLAELLEKLKLKAALHEDDKTPSQILWALVMEHEYSMTDIEKAMSELIESGLLTEEKQEEYRSHIAFIDNDLFHKVNEALECVIDYAVRDITSHIVDNGFEIYGNPMQVNGLGEFYDEDWAEIISDAVNDATQNLKDDIQLYIREGIENEAGDNPYRGE